MQLTLPLILSVALFATLTTGNICNCGLGPGCHLHDPTCHRSEHKLVIRPEPYVSPAIKEKFESSSSHKSERVISGGCIHPPQKDYVSLCSCGNTIVTPAHVPPPPCRKCGSHASTCTCSQTTCTSSSSSGSCETHDDACVCNTRRSHNHHDKLSHVPADPVSVALALKQHIHNAHIPRNCAADRDISFGFKKLPIEITQECKQCTYEGNLNTINGHVLELKLPRATVSRTVDEEAYDDLCTEHDDSEEHEHHVHKPSLSDLGFVSTRTADKKFVDLKVEKKLTCGVPRVPRCRDGFRPGKVILKEEYKEPHCALKERETVCCDGLHHNHEHSWSSSSGHSNSIFKKIACQSGCHLGYH